MSKLNTSELIAKKFYESGMVSLRESEDRMNLLDNLNTLISGHFYGDNSFIKSVKDVEFADRFVGDKTLFNHVNMTRFSVELQFNYIDTQFKYKSLFYLSKKNGSYLIANSNGNELSTPEEFPHWLQCEVEGFL